jgi:hypothetical protein
MILTATVRMMSRTERAFDEADCIGPHFSWKRYKSKKDIGSLIFFYISARVFEARLRIHIARYGYRSTMNPVAIAVLVSLGCSTLLKSSSALMLLLLQPLPPPTTRVASRRQFSPTVTWHRATYSTEDDTEPTTSAARRSLLPADLSPDTVAWFLPPMAYSVALVSYDSTRKLFHRLIDAASGHTWTAADGGKFCVVHEWQC